MLSYINPAQQLGILLEAMDFCIDGKEMAMPILNGLPPQFKNIVTTSDTLGNDS